MNFSPANVLAGSFAVLLHAGVAGMFLLEWESEQPAIDNLDKKYYIPAQIYAENPHTAKQERAAAEQARRQQVARDQRKAREAAARQKAIDAEKAKQQALDEARAKRLAAEKELDRLEQLRAEQAAKAAAEAERAEQEKAAEQVARADSELQKLINAEMDAIRAVTDDEKAMAYVGQIQADIIQNWSRPPSARNGMQTLLKVFLVPTGEVVDVSVLESSGNAAFDRSAIQAVRKVRRFDVPRESRLFEDKFREFEVLFRPEDLRI